MKKHANLWHTVRVMLPIAYKAAPLRFIFINVLGISQSLLMAANTLLLSVFVDALIGAVGQGSFDRALVGSTLLYVCGIIGYQLLNTLFNYALQEFLEICDEKFRYQYNQVIAGLFPLAFENNASLNEIQKAQAGRDVANVFIFHLIGIIDMVPPYLIFLSIYAASLNPLLLCCVAVSFLPSVVTLYMQRNVFYSYEDTAAPFRRRYKGYRDCMTEQKYFKETRTLGAFPFFFEKMKKQQEQLCSQEAAVKTKANSLDAINQTVGMLGYLGALAVLIYSVLNGSISVGSFAAVYYALGAMFDMIFALICGFIGSTIGNLPAVENYVSFLEEERKDQRGCMRDYSKDIVFSDVSFTYPDAARSSLKDLNLVIPAGQHVAVVGENGAGKSTFAKLLLGLYEPTTGKIHMEERSESTKQAGCPARSAVFQNYMRYQMTLHENVRISEWESKRNTAPLLERTGLREELVRDADSVLLSREFGGIDLSGGLWQQVAITRGQYREHELIVLDEPTAAVDPAEESDIYNKFLEMVKGKTAVIISHRLASARLADRILVVRDGQIVEDGSHEQLYHKKGIYRQMWDAQAESYQQ